MPLTGDNCTHVYQHCPLTKISRMPLTGDNYIYVQRYPVTKISRIPLTGDNYFHVHQHCPLTKISRMPLTIDNFGLWRVQTCGPWPWVHQQKIRLPSSKRPIYITPFIFNLQNFQPAVESSKCVYNIWASSLPNYLWHVGLLRILQLFPPLTLLQTLLRLWRVTLSIDS